MALEDSHTADHFDPSEITAQNTCQENLNEFAADRDEQNLICNSENQK